MTPGQLLLIGASGGGCISTDKSCCPAEKITGTFRTSWAAWNFSVSPASSCWCLLCSSAPSRRTSTPAAAGGGRRRWLERVGEGWRRFAATFYVPLMVLCSSLTLLLVQHVQVGRGLRPHLWSTGSHQENHHCPPRTSRWCTDLLQEAEHHGAHLLVGVVPQQLRPLGVPTGRQRPLQEPQLPLEALQLLLQVDLLLTWRGSTCWRGRCQSAEEPCDQVLTNEQLQPSFTQFIYLFVYLWPLKLRRR